MGRSLAGFVAVLMLLARDAQAQVPGPANAAGGDSIALAALVGELESHDRVRVRLRTDQPDLLLLQPRLRDRTLYFDRYGPGAWTLDTGPGPHAIPLTEIARVQVRTSAWQKGAIIGFLLGAAAIEGVNAAGKYRIDRGETVFIGGLFGTGGALAGALVAAPFHTWHTVYPPP